jgi:hypothetical protein
MPDVAGIAEFDYHPPAPEPETTEEGEESREASGNAEAGLALQDPPVAP